MASTALRKKGNVPKRRWKDFAGVVILRYLSTADLERLMVFVTGRGIRDPRGARGGFAYPS